MKPELLERLVCDRCGGELHLVPGGSLVAGLSSPVPAQAAHRLDCLACGRQVPFHQSIPLFSEPPEDLKPSEKIVRGPEIGTPWRRANWSFLQAQVSRFDPQAVILDVGAGRGDFAGLFLQHSRYLALDVYPYPEVDLVCDLSASSPLRPSSFDAVLLMNVLEHVYDGRLLLKTLAAILKPGGVLLIAIPFMVKMHQVPVDFARYTHFALQRMSVEQGLLVEALEGFYDPISLLGEGLGNLKNAVLPEMRGWRRYAGRALHLGLALISAALRGLLGPGRASDLREPLPLPDSERTSRASERTSPSERTSRARSLAPTGYHLVLRKPVTASDPASES